MNTAASDTRVSDLLATTADEQDLGWLQDALQVAVELELSTLPPYLCAYWSCKDQSAAAVGLIKSVIMQEMVHLGLAANMLTTIGGTPTINTKVPVYPGPLPGGVLAGTTVYLSGLTKDYLALFMAIEYPESGPITPPPTAETIGQFYDAIATTFTQLKPSCTGKNQLTSSIASDTVFAIKSIDDALKAIAEIKEQGEGTATSPDDVDFDDQLAHYYRFAEIYNGAKLVNVDGTWKYSGDPVPMPDAYPMAHVPAGGWPSPPANVAALLAGFNGTFTQLLDNLQAAWANGNDDKLNAAIGNMFDLGGPAGELMQIALPAGGGNYGPEFRYGT